MITYSCDFNPELYEELIDDLINIQSFLYQTLNDGDPTDEFSDCPLDEIGHFFLSSQSTDGGAPEISELELIYADLNDDYLTGKVSFEYIIGYYYTCSDMNSEVEHQDTCSFTIDTKENKVILDFFELPTRSTKDEY
jgi:hypothetical protein